LFSLASIISLFKIFPDFITNITELLFKLWAYKYQKQLMWRCIKPWDPGIHAWIGDQFREESRHQHSFYKHHLYSKLPSRCKSDKPMQQLEDRINKPQSGKSWFRWWDLCSIMQQARLPRQKVLVVNSENQSVAKIEGCWTSLTMLLQTVGN
jgi:hypothetical protein